MSFSTKFSFVPLDSGIPSISFDRLDYGFVPLSSNIRVIEENLNTNFKHLNFRKIGDYYYDFVTVLSWEEFLDFHSKIGNDNLISQDISSFITNYKEEVRYNWVVIEVYEWESGL